LSHYVDALRGAKYFAEARGVLQDALARDPRNSSLKADLIRVEAEANGVDAAAAEARAFAAGDPENDIYDLVMAGLYEKAGMSKDAITVLERAVAARSSADVAIALADLYHRTGDFFKAEAVLIARLRADPGNIAIGTAMARLYLTTGRAKDAKKIFSELLSRRPDDVGALRGFAEVSAAERNWPEAADYIARARQAAPNDPAPGITLVNLVLLRHDWTDAVTTAARIAEQFPANGEVLDAKGRAQIAAGDTQGAIATYKTICELSPHSISAMSKYVALLKEAKKLPDARTVLEAALARDPKNGEPRPS